MTDETTAPETITAAPETLPAPPPPVAPQADEPKPEAKVASIEPVAPRFKVAFREAMPDGEIRITAVPVDPTFPCASIVLMSLPGELLAEFDTDTEFSADLQPVA